MSGPGRANGPDSRSGPSGDRAGLAARRAALAVLRAVDEDDAWSNLAVADAIASLPDARDRAFAAHLAYDTLRRDGTLSWALGQVLTRPFEDVEPALRRVLLLGALQVLTTQVPPRAAVDTSVTLARQSVPRARAKGAGGFVNGVLRALVRRADTLPWPDEASDPIAALELSTAHPAWIVEDLLGRYGLERTRDILTADNAPPGVTLRATGGRDALIEELRAEGVDARAGALDEAVRAPGADPSRLACVAAGRAVVQDEASMHVVRATGVEPGDRVLDLCAGPGGKATHLAHLVAPSGAVTAVELHAHRAELIRGAARRQGLTIDVHVGDALEPPLPPEARFDAVLLDAPCTGLGTGRRRPEVRWRRTPDDARDLAALQLRLLRAALPRVADGGTLVYAVCTWTAAETDGVLTAVADEVAGAGFVERSRHQLLPDVDGTDGMFVVSWRRTGVDRS